MPLGIPATFLAALDNISIMWAGAERMPSLKSRSLSQQRTSLTIVDVPA